MLTQSRAAAPPAMAKNNMCWFYSCDTKNAKGHKVSEFVLCSIVLILLRLCAYTSLSLLSSYCYICVLIPRYLCRQVNEFNYNSTVDQIVLNSTTAAVLQGGQVEVTSV